MIMKLSLLSQIELASTVGTDENRLDTAGSPTAARYRLLVALRHNGYCCSYRPADVFICGDWHHHRRLRARAAFPLDNEPPPPPAHWPRNRRQTRQL
jgi:hypothetical protein